MKLIDGTKEIGCPFKVPNCSRDELPKFFVQMGYKTGAEIGVYRGAFTEKFCQAGLKIFAIDPWIGYAGAGRTEKKQEKQDINFKYAKKKLSPYKNCQIIRKTSMDALNDFKDQSLDFVYIDADHRFPYIAQDLYEWEKKVRRGGVVSGHDYFFTGPHATNVIIHVGPVLDAYVKIKGIDNFYVFGTTKSSKTIKKGDKTLSWLFFKP